MNAKTLAELALKIWGMTLLVSALASLPVVLLVALSSAGSDTPDNLIRLTRMTSILGVVMQAAVGTAVLIWADRITDLIESDTDALQIDTNTSELQVLGFALVGVFVLVDGLRNVASAAFVMFNQPKFDDTNVLTYAWTRQQEAIVRAAVQVVAGAILVFGRRGIAQGWSRLRGQPANDELDQSEEKP